MAEQQAKVGSPAAASTSSSAKETGENEKNPAISSPRWEDASGQAITKALVGDEVYFCAHVTDIADGAAATIKIVEKDADAIDDEVATLSAVVSGGRIKCRWQVKYTVDEDDADSRRELAERGYTLPEYAFVVECGGATSGESGVLEVRGGLRVLVKTNKTGAVLRNTRISLIKNDTVYKTVCTDSNGYFELLDIPIEIIENVIRSEIKFGVPLRKGNPHDSSI